MDAIVKATTKAATVAVITFYTPYGLIYAGGNVLFDLATAMNFDPITFKPGEKEIDDSAIKQLDDLAKLMKQKPQLHVTLCGQANREDAYAFNPDLEQPSDKDNKTETKLTDDEINKLKALASSRQDAIKDYLVKEKSIGPDKLILCEPEYNNDKDANAGVEINI
jgi:hypothetical protein